jgi:hypothetical protein
MRSELPLRVLQATQAVTIEQAAAAERDRNHSASSLGWSPRLAGWHPGPLQRRLSSALLLARDAGFLQVQLALDAAARFIGDPALLQQTVDKFAFRSDQLRSQVCCYRSGIEPVRRMARQTPDAILLTSLQNGEDLG